MQWAQHTAKICIKYRKHWKSYVSFQLSGQTGQVGQNWAVRNYSPVLCIKMKSLFFNQLFKILWLVEKVMRRLIVDTISYYIDILWIIRYFLQAPFTSWQPISSSCWYSSKLLVIAYLEVLAILLIAELSTSSSTPSQNHIASLNNCCLGIHKRRLKLVLF